MFAAQLIAELRSYNAVLLAYTILLARHGESRPYKYQITRSVVGALHCVQMMFDLSCPQLVKREPDLCDDMVALSHVAGKRSSSDRPHSHCLNRFSMLKSRTNLHQDDETTETLRILRRARLK